MRHLPVHWYEGLFLRPQHFQAADRYWTERVQTGERWDHPFGYGLRVLDLCHDALASGQLQIDRIEARMPDGTLVALGAGQEPDRLDLHDALPLAVTSTRDLGDAFEKAATVDVLLAVPHARLGTVNVSRPGHDIGKARYVERQFDLHDESEGGNDQAIGLRDLNARLLLSTDNRDGFDVLPIARIRRASRDGGFPELDPSFIPPLLTVSAWPPLLRGTLWGILDRLRGKLEILSEQIINRGVHFGSQEPGDLERVLMLGALNETTADLAAILSGRPTPFEAYHTLSRIAGRLTMFTPERHHRDLPEYDHERLADTFEQLRKHIDVGLTSVPDYAYRKRNFIGTDTGLEVSVEPEWFHSGWEWFIGVHHPALPAADLRELLSPGKLDWKFGSARQVETLFRRRASGLDLTPLSRVVRNLPTTAEWSFFEVQQNDSPAYRDVNETLSIGVRIRDALIRNLDTLTGSTDLVVDANGQPITLRFALFAVPESV